MKYGRFKGWIGCVTVCFPTPIQQIDLDTTRNWAVAIDPNCSIPKIRAGFTVPNPELNDFDLIAIRADEFFPKVSRKPTRLQLQLGWNPRRCEQRALMNASRIAHLRVALCQRAHARIMRTAMENVTAELAPHPMTKVD